MKTYCSKISSYLLCFFASLWVGVIAVIILTIPFNMIIDSGVLSGRLFEGVSLTIFPAVFLFFSMKKKGYKSAELNLRETVFCMCIVFVVQQILSFVIGYAIYLSGGAIHLSQAIFLNDSVAMYENESVFPLLASTAKDVPLWSYHIIMLVINAFAMMPAVIAGKNAGVKKRMNERKELDL